VLTSYRVLDCSGHSGFGDRVVPDLVVKTMCVMHLARRAFEAFAHLALDLALFVERRVFPRVARS
jgi:hypothetical protein